MTLGKTHYRFWYAKRQFDVLGGGGEFQPMMLRKIEQLDKNRSGLLAKNYFSLYLFYHSSHSNDRKLFFKDLPKRATQIAA